MGFCGFQIGVTWGLARWAHHPCRNPCLWRATKEVRTVSFLRCQLKCYLGAQLWLPLATRRDPVHRNTTIYLTRPSPSFSLSFVLLRLYPSPIQVFIHSLRRITCPLLSSHAAVVRSAYLHFVCFACEVALKSPHTLSNTGLSRYSHPR